jgi:hypothetical protein
MTEVRMTRPQIIPATTKITAAWKRNTDAIDGLSRVARAIVAVPAEARTKAFAAAEDSYRQTARELGYDETEVQEWTAGIMFRLRAEVALIERAKQKNKAENDVGRIPTEPRRGAHDGG